MIPLIESFGIIPLRKIDGEWKVFLILHKEGHHWGFPKGRKNPGEDHFQAAQRELLEETGLRISKLLQTDPVVENYGFRHQGNPKQKRVYYFIAEVEGEIVLQPEEIREGKWFLLAEALEILSFAQARTILQTAAKLLF